MSIQELTISLDLKQNLNIYATCKQLDNLNLILSIYDNSVQADLTNYDVRLKAMKSDNIPLIQEHIGITKLNNVVTIVANEQLTTTSGKTLIELEFINTATGLKKSTFNLVLNVISSVLEVNSTISTATYTLLQELENKLDQAGSFLENITEAVEANDDLVANLAIANTLNTDLESNITTGTSLDSSLESNIILGNALKPELDAKNTLATSNIAAMESFGDVTTITQDLTALKNEVTTARGNESNLDIRLDKFDTSLSDRSYNCSVSISTSISLASSLNTNTMIPFDINIKDSKGIHNTSTNNTRVNILKAGFYMIIGSETFGDTSLGGYKTLGIKKNGTDWIKSARFNSINGNTSAFQISALTYLNVGD